MAPALDQVAGTMGHLTPAEDRKLREAWSLFFELGGVELGPDHKPSPSYQNLKSHVKSPATFRDTLWKASPDHPDVTILRFLRARKWDVEKAMDMLTSSINWREERQIHEKIIATGDSASLRSGDVAPSQQEKDLAEQYRTGKSFVRATDNEGRPVYVVRVRLHNPNFQTPETMEMYVLHIIETISCMMKSPREKCCLVFDLTGFGLKNMDFHLVKFLVQVFEARYPETLGAVLVHNAPFVFWGVWSIVKPWLDPVIAAKIVFTSGNGSGGLAKYIPKENLHTSYGGEDLWEYRYIEPTPGDNERLGDEDKRALIEAERATLVTQFEQATVDWIRRGQTDAKAEPGSEAEETKSQPAGGSEGGNENEGDARADIAEKLRQNYWKLDPYVRARTLYHRTGVIGVGGVIDLKGAS